ncbi:uncharacterized protein K02A2.6-like [Episyrphus balteatus]|uniref:uncharacterized protein K02A2.6-like n=1 Tax=Episyrphus balteatus TaxID=286459 RepID=UPI0024851E18|nr:uncharacterized protein K02A2.6-like [Episyrphus balteatus]
MLGLLDSGASISCLGAGCLDLVKSEGVSFKSFCSKVRTASGQNQPIIGELTTSVTYKGITKQITLYLVPSLEQTLYLGVNFWKSFEIAPQIISEISSIDLDSCRDSNAHELSPDQTSKLQSVIGLFPSAAKFGLGKTKLEEHTINTGDAEPVKQRHYPVSPAVQALMYDELDRMLALGVIEESQSAWSSPMVLVQKPGKNRLCLDSRKVNKVTKKDAYPLHHVDGLLSRQTNTHFISTVDLKDAFWQIPLEKTSREKTAFTVPGRALYQFTVMPFGLCNAAQRLCRLMDKVVPHELRQHIYVYLDDLLVVSSTFEEHITILTKLAMLLKNAGLTINLTKSKFCFKELKFLGYIIGGGCIRTDPDKVSAVKNFPIPKTKRQVRRFLGLSGWYRRFVNNYSALAAPLSDTTKNSKTFVFTPEALKAFEELKRALTSSPILINPDFQKPFKILCDASTTGVGSVLCQEDEDGIERPIFYFSHKLSPAQRNYSITELECLAAVLGVEKFRSYVEGQEFTVVTDHASLRWLMSQKDLTGRLARWSLRLQRFKFDIAHRKGTQNVVPDALSRVYSVDEIASLDNKSSASDVLQIDLTDPTFQSDEYKDLINTIETNQNQLPDHRLSDGYVYKKVKPCTGDPIEDDCIWKLWIPSLLTKSLIQLAHEPPKASHGGIAKTLYRLRDRFYWPNMAAQVKSFVGQCDVCKTTKAPNSILRPPMGQAFIVDRPFQHVYVDFLGPYPRSKNGNTHILVCLDQLTKFVLVKALRKATGENAIRFLEDEVFSIFGVPESLLSDNGKQFIGKEFSKFLTNYGTKHIKTASYAPQSNASERVNRSILAAIRSYIGKEQSHWDQHLQSIVSSLRSTIHSAIGMSPHEALFGHSKIEHGSDYELLKKLKSLSNPEFTIIPKSAKMNIIHKRIKDALAQSHKIYEKSYNLRSKGRLYKIGQKVFKRNFILSDASKNRNAKLCPKFVPALIKSIVGNSLYELTDLSGNDLGVVHGKDIRE